MQPIQQHGRRTPSLSSARTRSTCCRLVSAFLTEMVQQIHSLRASGVSASQAASASVSDVRVSRKSSGTSWTTPPEIACLVILVVCSYLHGRQLKRADQRVKGLHVLRHHVTQRPNLLLGL